MTYFVDDNSIKLEAYEKIVELVEQGANYRDIENIVVASEMMVGIVKEHGEAIE